MKKPVWLLDFDGVINVDGNMWPGELMRGKARTSNGFTYSVWWPPALINAMCEIISRDVVDVRWCTSWYGYTAQLESLVGLPSLSLALTDNDVLYGMRCAKLGAALRVIEDECRPLIWTDDEVLTIISDERSAFTNNSDVLLVNTSAYDGLTPKDIEDIEQFIDLKLRGTQ